jgi:hypothetical protein
MNGLLVWSDVVSGRSVRENMVGIEVLNYMIGGGMWEVVIIG